MSTEITIIQQNDTHGYLEPHPELFWHHSKPVFKTAGGFARIAGYVQSIRQQKQNVLFVDGGDLFHGTGPLVMSKGEIIVPLLSKMKIDAYVPGNWDFAYGPKQLSTLMGGLPAPSISANVMDLTSQKTFFQPYVIKEIHGIRVGLIGLTYPYVSDTMPPSFSDGLSFDLGVDRLPAIIEKLRGEEHVDLVMVASHMGLPLEVKLATIVNGLDVILSGHSHDRITRPIIQNGCIIIQSGASGSFLGRLDIKVEMGNITDFKHQLVFLSSEEYPEDPEVAHMVMEMLKPYRRQLDPVIGQLSTPLHRMTLNESPMDQLITDAYLHYTKADIAFSHGWRYGAPILPGPVTVKELYQIIPANPELFTLELDGQAVLKILESNLEQVYASDPFEQKGGYVLRSSNINMAYKPYNPKGHRIQHIEIKGEQLQLDKLYRVVAAGHQMLKPYTAKHKPLGVHSHDVLSEYFSATNDVRVEGRPRIITI